jgi:hypothetical protein
LLPGGIPIYDLPHKARVNRVTAVKKAPFSGAFASNHCGFVKQYTGLHSAVKQKLIPQGRQKLIFSSLADFGAGTSAICSSTTVQPSVFLSTS